jgi:hypothetical protein
MAASTDADRATTDAGGGRAGGGVPPEEEEAVEGATEPASTSVSSFIFVSSSLAQDAQRSSYVSRRGPLGA